MREPVPSGAACNKLDESKDTTMAAWNEVSREQKQPFGFININKPKGITSFDVIYKLRKILGVKKIGHSGTLDPLATGVLPIAVGNAARLIEFLEDDKKYVATLKFGETSTTYDNEGEKTFVANPDFSRDELEAAIAQFTGKIDQVPPIYSAIKIGGKKLYQLARKGESIEIQPRMVEIYSIKLLESTGLEGAAAPAAAANALFEDPASYGSQAHLRAGTISSPAIAAKIEVHCSKGTYVRSLAHDIGQKLGCGAYLAALERTEAGAFTISNSIAIEEASLKNLIAPTEVLPFPQYELDESQYQKVRCGNTFKASKPTADGKVILTYNGSIVALAASGSDTVKPLKVMVK